MERFLNLRYDGTDVAIMTASAHDSAYSAAFEDNYRREFGFTLEDRRIMVLHRLASLFPMAACACPCLV